MTLHRFQVVIPATSNVVADACVNRWHFDLTGGGDPIGSVGAALISFYNAWAAYRASLMTWEGTRLKVYDLTQPEPRVPVSDTLLGLSSAKGTTTMPPEVSLCLSFQAETVSGLNQKRRRNRVYLGPTNEVANEPSGRPATLMLTDLQAAAQALLNSSGTNPDWAWTVYSTFTPTSVVPVQNGWIDDEWDTQRRRGRKPTVRVVFTAAI